MVKVLDKIGNFLLKWKISKKTLAIIFVILFLLSLVPIIITAFYSVPIADDYAFGREVHLNYTHGESVLNGIVQTFKNNYFGSAGGFYSCFLIASCQPYVFNIHLYFISNLIVIFACIISLFYFAKVLIVDVFNTTLTSFLLISIPIVTVFIQFIPSAAEGFYWMDGSMTTLFDTSLFLIMITFILKYHLTTSSIGIKVYFILAIVLAIVLSGTTPFNFITYAMLFVCSMVYCIPRKLKVYKLQIIIFIILFIGLIIVMVAPGTAAKSKTLEGMPFYKSIIYALAYSVFAFGKWMTLLFVVALIFSSIVFYQIAQSSRFSFNNPLLVFIICYLVFAARFSLSYYTKGSPGAARQLNLYYYSFIVLMSISWLYFVGWISKRKELHHIVLNKSKISLVFVIIIGFISLTSLVGWRVSNGATTVSTTISLLKGQTQTYYTEMMERIEKYEDDSISDVVVNPLSVYPPFFCEETIKTDSNYWTNKSIASYYEKESVVLLENNEK